MFADGQRAFVPARGTNTIGATSDVWRGKTKKSCHCSSLQRMAGGKLEAGSWKLEAGSWKLIESRHSLAQVLDVLP
jgi:hypothetical protein